MFEAVFVLNFVLEIQVDIGYKIGGYSDSAKISKQPSYVQTANIIGFSNITTKQRELQCNVSEIFTRNICQPLPALCD